MKICTKIILMDRSEAHSWELSTLLNYLPFQSFGDATVPLLLWPFCTLPSRNLGHTSEMPNSLPSLCKLRGASIGHVKFSVRVRRPRMPDGCKHHPSPHYWIYSLGSNFPSFLLWRRKEKKEYGENTEKYAKRISSTESAPAWNFCCFKSITRMGVFFSPGGNRGKAGEQKMRTAHLLA